MWEIILDGSFLSYLEPHLNNEPNRWAREDGEQFCCLLSVYSNPLSFI